MIWVRALCSKYRSQKFVLLVALILLVAILGLIVVGGRAVALDVRCVVILFLCNLIHCWSVGLGCRTILDSLLVGWTWMQGYT